MNRSTFLAASPAGFSHTRSLTLGSRTHISNGLAVGRQEMFGMARVLPYIMSKAKVDETIQTRRGRIMKKLSILIVVLTLLSPNAWAFRGTCGLMGPGFRLNPHLASVLDLTEEQKAQIQAKQEAFLEEINPLRNRLFSRKMEMRDLWGQGNPDQSRISAKQREIQAIQSQIQEKTIQYQMECRELLTPEQQDKLGMTVANHGSRDGAGIRRNGK